MPRATHLVLSTMGTLASTDSAIDISQEVIADTASAPASNFVPASNFQKTAIAGAMETATMNIYAGSVIILLVIILVGGVCAYYVSGSALRPIKNLNENIKKVNTSNLTSNLSFDGPQDEIKELAISFNSMLAKLENAFSSQKRLNTSIAHELKTPLAVVRANIDILKDQEEKVIEDYRRTLSIVEQSVNKMNASIEALLDAVQEENAALDDNVKFDELISDITDDLKMVAEKKEIQLTCEIRQVPNIQGNEVLLYRAIYNVVENAIKYTPPKGAVAVSCGHCNHQIEILVSDSGSGMEEKEIKKIFEPFYRIKNYDKQNGLGLGLALTKSAIAIHGGKINVTSQIGKGTVFKIEIPAIHC